MLEKNFTLSTIKDNGLEEVFQVELEKVLENIGDLNTKAVKERTIDIKLKFKPTNDRDDIRISFEVKSKLAPYEEQTTSVYIGKEDGTLVAYEHEKGVLKNQIPLEETASNETENKDQKILKIN